jgi:hypothetical protein
MTVCALAALMMDCKLAQFAGDRFVLAYTKPAKPIGMSTSSSWFLPTNKVISPTCAGEMI